LPKIGGYALAHSFILRQAKRKVDAYLAKFQPDDVRWLIEKNKPLIPSTLESILTGVGKEYSWAAGVVTDEDLWNMMPEWFKSVVEEKQGQQWFKEQVALLRRFFK